MEPLTTEDISGDVPAPSRSTGRRYEAVLRLSEALSLCREPEDLTKILSDQLREFLEFLQFYIIVYKENSTEVEWAVVGREKSQMAAYADVPVQQRPSWQAYTTQEPFHIHDWNTDERTLARLKEGIAAQGLDVGPLVFVPLTTPHRRLGALGMSGSPGTVYSDDDIGFLRLIGRVVAFAIDDNFNLRQGWGWPTAVHPDDLNVLVDYWQGVLASGKPAEIEGRLRRFDGVYRWFLFRGTPAFDDNGKVAKWYGTNTDIEERKKAEQSLAIQNTRLQLLLKLTNQITSNLELRKVLRTHALRFGTHLIA
jgi:hypothetical protein